MKTEKVSRSSASRIDVSQSYIRLVYGKKEFWIGSSLFATVRQAMSMSEKMKKCGDESLKVTKIV